jgi:hypothetical protein
MMSYRRTVQGLERVRMAASHSYGGTEAGVTALLTFVVPF